LWRAGLISSTGDWVAILATLSLAEELAGGSGVVLALVSRILPGLFFAAVGGVIADRLNRKVVMTTVEIGRAALVFSLAFVSSIAFLVLVNLVLEALTLVFQPAKEATVPNLVRRNELVQANSLSLSAAYGTFPLGAALFLVIAPLGPHITLWGLLPGTHEGLAFLLDSGTYVASAAIISTLPIQVRTLSDRRRRRGRIDLAAPLRDLRDGVVFVATHPRVRPIVMAMTVALAGGGIVVVLGKPFAKDVLNAGTAGFPALLTAFGLGAGLGIVLVTVFGPRLRHKDISFAISLLVTGFALGAAGLVKTIFGGVGWISVMGFGAGSAYVLGFAHLHEQVIDEVRGRTFAALFSLMRIGLLTSMTIALPLAEIFDGLLPGLLADGYRVVLILGGTVMFGAGLVTLWSLRRWLTLVPDEERRRSLEAATEAFHTYRQSVSGHGDGAEAEYEAFVDDDAAPEVLEGEGEE
jgi:dTMP kinase